MLISFKPPAAPVKFQGITHFKGDASFVESQMFQRMQEKFVVLPAIMEDESTIQADTLNGVLLDGKDVVSFTKKNFNFDIPADLAEVTREQYNRDPEIRRRMTQVEAQMYPLIRNADLDTLAFRYYAEAKANNNQDASGQPIQEITE